MRVRHPDQFACICHMPAPTLTLVLAYFRPGVSNIFGRSAQNPCNLDL